jgi:hypothetical protein
MPDYQFIAFPEGKGISKPMGESHIFPMWSLMDVMG